MKKHSQISRLGFALAGLGAAWRQEASFRTEIFLSGAAALALFWLRAGLQPWLIWLLGTTLVLSVELVNSALETLCDTLHPAQHPGIKIVKDCASAAVLVVVTGVGLLFAVVLWRLW